MFDEAADEYQRAIKIDPNHAKALLNLGKPSHKAGAVPEGY